MKKIGVLGGTFNPVHNGHLALAEKALKEYGLEMVVFIPTGLPPHKSTKDLAPNNHRLKMLSLAIKNHPKYHSSKIEINRSGYSYAVDTFKKLRKRYGASYDICYIMGLDSINSILSWKKPLDLFKLCDFIIATRPGSKIKMFKRIMKFPPISINKDKISLFELHWNVSSSDIRDKIRHGKDISKLVPKAVVEYIKREGLYLHHN